MQIMYMVDNLGIYNSEADFDYDINKHFEQGVQFKQYSEKIYSENQYNFLQESTGPEWDSTVDAYNGENSTKKRGMIEGMTMSENQAHFNNGVSQYARDYNTYTSTLLKNSSDDASRKSFEKKLLTEKNNILSAANNINKDVKNSNVTRGKLLNSYHDNQKGMIHNLRELNKQKQMVKELENKYDVDSINGAIENTTLNMNSMYYHVFVYLIIAVTLLAFIFNLMVNPAANVLNVIYVLGALFTVYIISKYYVN